MGSLFNAGAIADLASPDGPAITLALFLLAAEMAMQTAAAPLLGIDVRIDPCVAHGRLFLELQPPRGLLRIPVPAHKSLDFLPSLPGDARTIGSALPIVGQFVRLMRPIAYPPVVAPQFTKDRALMAPQHLSLVSSRSFQGVYLISLFTSKLLIVDCVLLLT